MTDTETINECLSQIHAANLDHEQLLSVAAVMKDNGMSMADFSSWFSRSKQVNDFMMRQQWDSIKGSSNPVKVGTLVKLCRDFGGDITTSGFDNVPFKELDWDAEIGPGFSKKEDLKVIKQDWLEDAPLPPYPDDKWNGSDDLRKYIALLFQADEKVGYVTESWPHTNEDGTVKWLPKKGNYDRTAGELLEALSGAWELGEVVGDWNPKAGAWIRFNPLDGTGVADKNVTAHRFALVESDKIPVERQHAIYRQLELPIAALVHSAGKSLHAIVRIDAPDLKEYQRRVDFLYQVCGKNGLSMDRSNKNPSRLSRMPGATRDGNKQWIVATNIGKSTWQEWEEHIVSVNDDLPDFQNLADVWNNMPPLSDSIIDGVLRMGHKMLVTGPSKAGKSYLLMRLCMAIAEGVDWLGWRCQQGRVLYVNLELDHASAMHRLKDHYAAYGLEPKNISNIDIWNLRGKAMPMDMLAPKLIRRSMKRRYSAIVIDPIYKVITGDENAADQMAKFCNQFDRLCCELKCATVYCHHHSKGDQGQKRASDRASGSGVFARDPDALLDIIELEITDQLRRQISNRWESDAIAKALDESITKEADGWRQECPQDDIIVADKLAVWCEANGCGDTMRAARPKAALEASMATGWRIEGILREFAPFKPKRFFFRHPRHVIDDGLLTDAVSSGEKSQRSSIERKQQKIKKTFLTGMEVLDTGDGVTIEDMCEYLGRKDRCVKGQMAQYGYGQKDGKIIKKDGSAND